VLIRLDGDVVAAGDHLISHPPDPDVSTRQGAASARDREHVSEHGVPRVFPAAMSSGRVERLL
jgi:hypothetical protein